MEQKIAAPERRPGPEATSPRPPSTRPPWSRDTLMTWDRPGAPSTL